MCRLHGVDIRIGLDTSFPSPKGCLRFDLGLGEMSALRNHDKLRKDA